MKKYQLYFNYNFGNEHQNTASIKPIDDSSRIATKLDFEPVYINSNLFYLYYQLFYYLNFRANFKKKVRKIKKGDIVFIQYPIYATYRFGNTLSFILSYFKKKGIYTIGLIHDIENLRNFNENKLRKEIQFLNKFSYLIVHNDKMKSILKAYGLNIKTTSLNIFDYLVDNTVNYNTASICSNTEFTIVFAGNLNKSRFVNSLEKIKNVKFHLFGNGYSGPVNSDNITYYGSVSPTELNNKMALYNYGLVWDGNIIEQLDDSENYSRYMRYNNPFKLSSYISAGIPVITSKDAAIADFVLDNNIGIVVESLMELENPALYLNYADQKRNVNNLKFKINEGSNLLKSLNIAVDSIVENFNNPKL